MKPLQSESGARKLDQIVKPGMLCVFDFDGTLSPIVSDYADAVMLPGTLDRLIVLSALTPVAILTGRAVADIQPRLHFQPHYLIGNHGLEGLPDWQKRSEDYFTRNENWRQTLSKELEAPPFQNQGIRLENKKYSLSIHYRFARDHQKTKEQLLKIFGKMKPRPRVIEGKYVLNLVSPEAPHKGNALDELMALTGAPSVLYVGDDVTDEDVFQLERADMISIRIANHPESAAHYYLEKVEDMTVLLDDLIERLQTQESGQELTTQKQ